MISVVLVGRYGPVRMSAAEGSELGDEAPEDNDERTMPDKQRS